MRFLIYDYYKVRASSSKSFLQFHTVECVSQRVESSFVSILKQWTFRWNKTVNGFWNVF